MLPGVDGFAWDLGHIIFLGAFFSVVTAVILAMVRVAAHALRDRDPKREQAIRWHMDFSELPAADRRCRHELTGEVRSRQCPNEFDCRECQEHPKFLRNTPVMAEVDMQALVAGMPVPLDRLYHRGHAWAKRDDDGTYTIGLDEFASRLLGADAKFELPQPGASVFANGTAWLIQTANDAVRVLSPVSGTVVRCSGRTITVQPAADFRADHLLKGEEVKAWLRKEIERLQIAMGGSAAPALADGGALANDLPAECPDADWSDVRARMLLNA